MNASARQHDTLAAALPREMVRVARLTAQYRAVAGGELAAAMMDVSIDRAQAAIEAADLPAMIRAYADLQGYEA